MPYTPEQIAKLKATDPSIVRQALERMSDADRSELMAVLQGGTDASSIPEMIPSHYQEPQMIPSHSPASQPPQVQGPDAEPETTAGGVLGAINRGVAPYAAGAALGGAAGLFGGPLAPVSVPAGALTGVASVGLTKLVGDPIVHGINSLLGTKYSSPSESLEDLMTRIGIPEPKTEAERIIRTASEAAASAGSGAALGQTMLRGQSLLQQANPTRSQAIYKMLADQPASQVVGGAGAGAASQYVAEEGGGAPAQLAAGLLGGAVAGAPFIRTRPKVQSTIGAAERASMAMPERQPIQTLADIVENTKKPGAIGEQARRDLAQLAPVSKEAKAALDQVTVGQAEQAGVRVLTSDVRPPRSFVTKFVQATGEKIPWAGTGGVRQAQQSERIEAIRDLFRDYGVGDIASASDEVMKDLVKKRSTDLTKYANMKKEVIDKLSPQKTVAGSPFTEAVKQPTWTEFVGQRMGGYMKSEGGHAGAMKRISSEWKSSKAAPNRPAGGSIGGTVPLPKSTAEIDSQIARLRSIGSDDSTMIADKLEGWKTALQDQPLANVEALRAEIGQSFGNDPRLAGVRDAGTKALTAIYRPLKEDMGDFIKTNGESKDYVKWQIANRRLSGMAGELEQGALSSVLRSGNATPEDVQRMLFSQKPSEVSRLYRNLPADGKQNAKVAILAKIAKESGGLGEESPAKFITAVKKLGSPIGVVFDKSEIDRIEGLYRTLKLTSRADQSSLVPSTGVQAVPIVMASFLTDLFGGMGGATVGAATIGGMARAYESAPVRNLLMRMSKTKPGSIEEATIARQVLNAMRAEQATKEKE